MGWLVTHFSCVSVFFYHHLSETKLPHIIKLKGHFSEELPVVTDPTPITVPSSLLWDFIDNTRLISC